MAKSTYDYKFKILIVGDSGVGKSNLLTRFSSDVFYEKLMPTIGVDFKETKVMEIMGKKVKLMIWDTAGQEKFHAICQSFYRGSDAVVFTYDVTNSGSFDNIAKWLRNVDEQADRPVAKVIVGNKSDLEHLRVINPEKGREISSKYDIPFFETSAKMDVNVSNMFYSLARRLVEEKISLEEKTIINSEVNSDNKVNSNPSISLGSTNYIPNMNQVYSCASYTKENYIKKPFNLIKNYYNNYNKYMYNQ